MQDILSIPVAVNTRFFRWQAELWWFAQRRVHGDDAPGCSLLLVGDRNFGADSPGDPSWYGGIPHVEFRGVWADPVVGDAARSIDLPLNIQRGLKAALPTLPADRVVEVIDCDLFRHAMPPAEVPGPGEAWTCDLYEDWHLRSRAENRHVIDRYLRDDAPYNGGFVPIVATAGTLAGIVDDWDEIHRDILRRDLDPRLHWWAGMFAFNAACSRSGVAMIGRDTCFIPPANRLRDGHYISHYSVDPRMPKRSIPNVDAAAFPDDRHYRMVRDFIAGARP
jgi:hypothetical protein